MGVKVDHKITTVDKRIILKGGIFGFARSKRFPRMAVKVTNNQIQQITLFSQMRLHLLLGKRHRIQLLVSFPMDVLVRNILNFTPH